MPETSRTDPFLNFRFRVEIDGIAQAGFTHVIMPEASVDVIEYREGGEKSTVRKLPGRVRYGNIVLEWGITHSRELYEWWAEVQRGHVERRNGSIILMDQAGNDVVRWNFRDAWPRSYQPSALTAEGRDALIEKMEIVHEGIERDLNFLSQS